MRSIGLASKVLVFDFLLRFFIHFFTHLKQSGPGVCFKIEYALLLFIRSRYRLPWFHWQSFWSKFDGYHIDKHSSIDGIYKHFHSYCFTVYFYSLFHFWFSFHFLYYFSLVVSVGFFFVIGKVIQMINDFNVIFLSFFYLNLHIILIVISLEISVKKMFNSVSFCQAITMEHRNIKSNTPSNTARK